MNKVHNILGFKVRMKFSETHHLYWGLALIFAGMYIFSLQSILGSIILLLGLWCTIDDIYQHHMQVENPAYHSPIHVWYGKTLWQYKWVQKLDMAVNEFFRLFAKK